MKRTTPAADREVRPRHRRDDAADTTPRGAVRRELHQLGRGPRKGLGQHFLARPEVARRIVDLARLSTDDRVVEIGPGLGALTDLLAARARELWVIELDRDLAARLRARHQAQSHLHVVEADVLHVDFATLLGAGPAAVVVANLPYNIATAVLRVLLSQSRCFARLILMVQREVAERLRAQPGGKAYGALSVLTQIAATVRTGLHVSPDAFVPAPKVDSEVVIVEPHAITPVAVRDGGVFRRVVRAAFSQRRKQLANSLRSTYPNAAAVLRTVGIDPTRRAETLSLSEFAALSNALTPQP